MQTSSATLTDFEQGLHKNKLRLTKTRRSIFSALATTTRPLTIQEIVCKISDAHFVSVYRSVDALLRAKLIKQVPIGFKNTYELSDIFKPHHHHISCENCGKSFEVNDKRIEKTHA